MESSKQTGGFEKQRESNYDSKSNKKSTHTVEKDGKKKEFRDIGVQVGGGIDQASNQFPGSHKGMSGGMSRQTSSQSPSKNEKLVSDLRKTAAKNSLLKNKAYKRNYQLDSGAVASSLSGFPSANNKQF
jgi:hypothetical protein